MTELEVECLAHRYLYYVAARPIISDLEYDQLEKRAISELPEGVDSPLLRPGSDRAEEYPVAVLRWLFEQRRRNRPG